MWLRTRVLVSSVVRLVLFVLFGWIYTLVCLIPYVGPHIAFLMGAVDMTGPRAWQACPVPKTSASCHLCISLDIWMKENCGTQGVTPITCPIAVAQYFAGYGSLIADVLKTVAT